MKPNKMKVLLVGPNSVLGSGKSLMVCVVALLPKVHVHGLGVFLDLIFYCIA